MCTLWCENLAAPASSSPASRLRRHSLGPSRPWIATRRRKDMAMSGKRNFLITGAGSGFGRALATEALSSGYSVIGTVRSEAARQEFGAIDPARARAIVLDVTDFGAVAMIKAVLPFMRERRRGHIINITSMAGYVGLAGIPYYAGSKFALEGISEVLANEVRGFGIKVTAVAPGAFRTDWGGRSMIRSPRSIADYDLFFDPIRRARAEKSGQQAGDPTKAARAILKAVETDNPPMHLLLGNDALKLVRDKLNSLGKEIDTWESVTRSTEYT